MTAAGAEDLDRLAEAFVEQARRGEAPSIEAVAKRHPALAEEIRELFPVLALVEGLKAETTAPTRRAPALPDRVGDYEFGPELGRGGMGTVYEGRRVGSGSGPERVAIKVVHAHLLERPEFIARFLQEAAAGRRVEHENVVRTLETGMVDAGEEEVPYILLELVEGQNLRALLREVEIVPERLCRHVGIRLADALSAVHEAGLVHRDVKPENVVITHDETVKLMDLGVAVVQDRLQRLSRTGEFVGSLLYAAPGQVAGEDPHTRWDLHALGILLYELATGTHPARNAGLRWLRANEPARTALTRHDALAGLSPFFRAVIESLLAAEDDGSLGSAATVRDVLLAGEASAWWKARRDAAVTPAERLQRIARPTAFYGRKAEWKQLDRMLANASEGHGQVALVEGEAGIGKSRLLYEWAASLRGTQTAPRVMLLTHAPGGAGGDESQLSAAVAQIVGEEDLELRLTELLASRARLASGLARRIRGEPGGPGEGQYDAAWLRLLQALAAERPILLVAEDLHFASSEDLGRFLFLARGASTPGLLLIGTFRPEPEPPGIRELALREYVTHLALEGLDTEACHQLVFEASADTPQLGESVQSIAERSDRNPMLLLELVRRTQDRARDGGSGETTVPDSIRGLLTARVALLEPSDRELLETAACQGYEFDPIVVAHAADLGRVQALKRFARMERSHHLLRAAGRLYQFQHHLVQEVLYTELHPALCEAYHAAIGIALESTRDDPTDSEAVALCTHFLKGDLPERAKPHLRRAMEYLEWGISTYASSETLATMALGVEGLLEGTDRASALFIYGRTCVSGARLDEADEALGEALALAREHDEGPVEVDTLKLLSWLSRRRGEIEKSLEYLELAAERAHALGSPGMEATSISRLSVLHMDRGHYDEADVLSQRAFAVLGDSDDYSAAARLKGDLAVLRIYQGRLEEADALLTEVGRMAHAHGDGANEFLNVQEQGRLAFRRGRFDDASRHARSALELGRHLGMHHRDAFLLGNLGRCLQMTGRYAEAQRCLEEAAAIAGREADPVMKAGSAITMVPLHTARGELGIALATAASARELVANQSRDDIPVDLAIAEAGLLAILGRFAEARERLDDTEAAWSGQGSAALGVGLETARARVLEAEGLHGEAHATYAAAAERARSHSLLGAPHTFWCARSLFRAGRPDEAEEGLREALAWARESGVPSFIVLAQAHLATLPDGDPLAARVALEHYMDRLTPVERIEAHYALWEVDGEDKAVEAAWRELGRLLLSAPIEDRDAMRANVDLFRRVTEAWESRAASQS